MELSNDPAEASLFHWKELIHATYRMMHYHDMLKRVPNPESDEYEYLSGMLDYYINVRIRNLEEKYNKTKQTWND